MLRTFEVQVNLKPCCKIRKNGDPKTWGLGSIVGIEGETKDPGRSFPMSSWVLVLSGVFRVGLVYGFWARGVHCLQSRTEQPQTPNPKPETPNSQPPEGLK